MNMKTKLNTGWGSVFLSVGILPIMFFMWGVEISNNDGRIKKGFIDKIEKVNKNYINNDCSLNPIFAEIIGDIKILPNAAPQLYSTRVTGGSGTYINHEWSKVSGGGEVNITNNNDGTALLERITAGKFYLQYKVTDSNGCVDSTTLLIANVGIVHTVNTTDNLDDGVCDEVHCSLIEATEAARNDGEVSLVAFNIAGGGSKIIRPIEEIDFDFGDIIDGTTQPGNNPMRGLITIHASNFKPTIFKIHVERGSTIKGIRFDGGFSDDRLTSFLVFRGEGNLIIQNQFHSINGRAIRAPTERAKSSCIIKNNEFFNVNRCIQNFDLNVETPSNFYTLSQNSMSCNNDVVYYYRTEHKNKPDINYTSFDTISGSSEPKDLIEVFLSDNSECENNSICQGKTFIGSTKADINGNWILSGIDLACHDVITATATSSEGLTSDFSNCVSIFPESCTIVDPTFDTIYSLKNEWQKMNGGNWEETNEGLKFYGTDRYDGNSILSDKEFDLSNGAEIRLKWKARSYFHMNVSTGLNNLWTQTKTTSSFSSTLLQNDKWYFTSISIDENGSFNTKICLDNYFNQGGRLIAEDSGMSNFDVWQKLADRANIRLAIGSRENQTGDLSYMVLQEALISVPSVTISSLDTITYDFNDNEISSNFELGREWKVSGGNLNFVNCKDSKTRFSLPNTFLKRVSFSLYYYNFIRQGTIRIYADSLELYSEFPIEGPTWNGDFVMPKGTQSFSILHDDHQANCYTRTLTIDNFTVEYDTITDGRILDSLDLLAIYNSTDGANWTNTWNLHEPIDTWYGVSLNDTGRVSTIVLPANNLIGILPNRLNNLSELIKLDLSDNHIGGIIPREISGLENIQILNLSNNNFTGAIPDTIGSFPLDSLLLNNNNLDGCIPNSFKALCATTYVNIVENPFLPENLIGFCNQDYYNCSLANNCGNSALSAKITGNTHIRLDTLVYLLGAPSSRTGNYLTHHWRKTGGDGKIDFWTNKDTLYIIGLEEGVINMEYQVVDSSSCYSIKQFNLEIDNSPCLYSSLRTKIIGDLNLLPNETKILSSETSGGSGNYIAYNWSQTGGNGQVNIVNQENGKVAINGITPGHIELQLEVHDDKGCIATTQERIIFVSNVYTINTTDIINDGLCDNSHCSWVEAVNAAKNDGAYSLIAFDIAGSNPHVIKPKERVQLGVSDIIDGATQYKNNPLNGDIILSGDSILSENLVVGILSGSSLTIRGITFERYNYPYISLIGSNSLIEKNTFHSKSGHGIYISNTTHPIGSFTPSKNIIRKNKFYNNSRAFSDYGGDSPYYWDYTTFSQNEMSCNEIPIFNYQGTYHQRPIIELAQSTIISGTSNPKNIIEVFIADSECSLACQGETYLGTAYADINGNWQLTNFAGLKSQDFITATATDENGLTSPFSSCFLVLPDDCGFAEPLPMNDQPCSTTGIVLDLKELNDSGVSNSSNCSSSYQSNDAWYTLTIPEDGNCLVRANLNNTVNPIIEAYTGTCDNPNLVQCGELDSIPYTMVFENYTPGSKLYLRVWDKDNTLVDSDNTALLHLTAHELPLNKDDWEICDFENNLINGNPTILSERDANSFIIEFDSTATPAEISTIQQRLELEGASLSEECLCKGAPLQLWKSPNPIDMEDRRRSARRRAKVDTTNYNYIFETVEFQVNAYAIGQQYGTDVAMDQEGNFAMTWIDEQRKHNYGRVYKSSGNPITQEFQIGASDKTQYATDIAMADNGGFIAVWHEIDFSSPSAANAIYGRQYNADGTPKAPPFNISKAAVDNTLNSEKTAEYGTNPKVSLDGAQNFIVTWHVNNHIYLQRFNANAGLVGSLFSVDVAIDNPINSCPTIAEKSDGTFIITWTGYDSDETGIYGQLFESNGNAIGDAFLVNDIEEKAQGNPEVAILDDGSFIVVWESYEQEGIGKDYGIYAQRFDGNGIKLGTEFLVNSYTNDAQRHPSISLFDNGSFIIAWSSRGQDGFEEGIYAKFYDANGIEVSPPFDDSEKGSSGNEFRLNTYHEPEQDKPSTATNGTNIMITAWEDGANDGSFKGIFAQRYEFIEAENTKIFYPIGTATPSSLLGDQLGFPSDIYTPTNAVKKAKVAIIDTGIDEDHPHLMNALWLNPAEIDDENCVLEDVIGYDFVNESGIPNDLDGHGTKVNGILTRNFNPDVQLELMNLKFHELNRGKVFDAICAIYYAVDNGADILNLSWGFEASEYPSILYKALKYAADNDILVVTTAGNTSKNNDRINKFPANMDLPNLLVVTSYEFRESNGAIRLANYASYGKNTVDIAAYGFMETPIKGGNLEASAGTSLAAPLVARTAAIIKGLYPVLTATEIKACILSSARPIASLTNIIATGGILNHEDALECARLKEEMISNAACTGNDLMLSMQMTPEDCNRYNGSIQLTVTGGVGQKEIVWSNEQSTTALSGLAAGLYGVTVTDELRCAKSLEINISYECGASYCNEDLKINAIPIPSNQYRSSDSLTSSGMVMEDSSVVFMATDVITLKPGFVVQKGANFLAKIEDCQSNIVGSLAQARTNSSTAQNKNQQRIITKIYPNPSAKLLHIEVEKGTLEFELEVFDLMGRSLGRKKVRGNKTTMSVEAFAAGIYYIAIDGITAEKVVVVNQ